MNIKTRQLCRNRNKLLENLSISIDLKTAAR